MMAHPQIKESEVSIHRVIEKIEKGLPVATFTKIRKDLGLPDKELARVIRVPKSTLAVRKKTGKFSFEEFERLYRIQSLFEKAFDVFGDVELAENG